jgi:antitoxin HigA-1
VHERRAVTPDMALRLARALRTTPELWPNLQQTYDLWHAARQPEDWRQVQELVTSGVTREAAPRGEETEHAHQ